MEPLVEIAWLAGLVEGEGCFYFRIRKESGRLKFIPLITVGSSDVDVIKHLAKLWGSSVRKTLKGVNKPQYTTVISGRRAIGWMMTIYSFMSLRRKQKIQEIIHQWKECRK